MKVFLTGDRKHAHSGADNIEYENIKMETNSSLLSYSVNLTILQYLCEP